MIEAVKITKVISSDKSKEGKPFITQKGKPFWKVAIKTDKYPNDWMSALAFDADDAEMKLQEGDEVKIIIETNGNYKNFKLPSRLDQVEERLAVVENWMRSNQVNVFVGTDKEIQIDKDDLPF